MAASHPGHNEIFTQQLKVDLSKPRYDMLTYQGRLRHYLDIVDPRTLLVGSAQLAKDKRLLADYAAGRAGARVTDADLWSAKKRVDAIIHPDTGEEIFMPFRMSGYVVFGAPMVAGLLIPNPTLLQTAFWQWLNQSHNAAINYCNRNASRPTSTRTLLEGYTGAVTSAVGIALSLSLFLKKAQAWDPAKRMLAQRFVPYPAVAMANVCNVFLMRRGELKSGVEVVDKNGNLIGVSNIAARMAVSDTMLTRILLPLPIFVLPPLLMTQLEKRPFLKRWPRIRLPLNGALGILTFAITLPACLALFPQESKVATNKLEKEIQSRTNEIELFYNKGL